MKPDQGVQRPGVVTDGEWFERTESFHGRRLNPPSRCLVEDWRAVEAIVCAAAGLLFNRERISDRRHILQKIA